MAFSIFFVLTWLAVFTFGVIQKKLSLVENTFVFLITLIVSINFSWIVMNELELIKRTEETLPYTASLLNRSIIIPVLLLIQLNMSMARDSFLWKTVVMLSAVLVLVGLSYLMTALNITDNTDWNLGLDAIYFFLLNLIAYFAYWVMESVSEKAVNQS
ncbi:hypothetical protein [Lentibacillus sp. CBA3610]|uniref:hypothetical protein n=1 Tax=Lentibacillus sp. CBA3610 TaxID=2518176 RepID=UPI001595DA1E|nr:hypothetical protein [Lentibacillus sp. CBA3610]QKY70707.1 hypothetical protein Len3610_14875 [Lentibacillus sp. CBA3610]